jgi:hypothetical protein
VSPLRSEPVEDLFGEVHVQDEIPRRGTRGYEAYLNSLSLPDGLTFWSLGPDTGLPEVPSWSRKHVESLWCRDRQGGFVHLLIDIRTGERWTSG